MRTRYGCRGHQASRLDEPKPRFLGEVVVHVEIDAHKAAISILAVVNRRVGREEIAVVVVLVSRSDVGLALGNLIEPAILVFLAQIEWLHVTRRAQFVLGAEIAGGGGIEDEAWEAVANRHGVNIKEIGVGRMEAHQGLERALIEVGAVVGRIQQAMMQISIHRADRELSDLPDMHSQHFPSGLLRQLLRDQDDRQQNGRGDGGRDQKDIGPELA